jgi:hypothetical protein
LGERWVWLPLRVMIGRMGRMGRMFGYSGIGKEAAAKKSLFQGGGFWFSGAR